MTTESKGHLQRLQILSPCQSAWEAMAGDERRRHCQECDKHVYDFAELTPREIARLVEATGGYLCGRLTRDARGQLVTRRSALPSLSAMSEPPGAFRRASPLAAAAAAAVLGLGAAAGTEPVTPLPLPTERAAQEASATPGERPQQTKDTGAGGAVTGRLTTETGQPVPDADVRLHNQLDEQERTGRTDADGRFVFPALAAGIYWLDVSINGVGAAFERDLLIAAGDRRQVGLTVHSELWQQILTGEMGQISGGISAREIPLRQTFAEAPLVVLGTAGKSVVADEDDDYWEVRTDLVIAAVVKGDTRERVIAVYHGQLPDEDAEGRFHPGDRVLAFLDPRETDDGGFEGYESIDHVAGLRRLPAAEAEAYRERLEALARLTSDGAARPADHLDWLVATTEEPATREIAAGELSTALWSLGEQAQARNVPADQHAHTLRTIYADFLAEGGKPEGESTPALVAAYLSDAHRERLTAALQRIPNREPLRPADLDLYAIVRLWHEDRQLPWLLDKLAKAELASGVGRLLMTLAAEELGDEALEDLLKTGQETIQEIENERDGAEGTGQQHQLDRKLAAAEEELRRKFVQAMGRSGKR